MQDLKRSPRIKDTALLELLKYEADECEVTGLTGELALHHVIFKSQQGDDVRENIICLNGDLHRLYHSANPLARFLIAEHVDKNRPDIACYIAEKLGGAEPLLEWFSRHMDPLITKCVCDRISIQHCPVHGNRG